METGVTVMEDAGSAGLTVAFSVPQPGIPLQIMGLQLTLSAMTAAGTASMYSI